MLSRYGKREWLIIIVIGAALIAPAIAMGWWIVAALIALIAVALLSFFRDPQRQIPSQRGQMVSPADGRISSIHQLDHYEPLDAPAVCIRVFMSVLNVHVNRSPCHGRVTTTEHKPGRFINALKPESAELNESQTTVLYHPSRSTPIAAIRQVAGAIARRIVCDVRPGDILQRGQRFGIIKFGSTVELYLPHPDRVEVQVRHGQKVYAGATVLAVVNPGPAET